MALVAPVVKLGFRSLVLSARAFPKSQTKDQVCEACCDEFHDYAAEFFGTVLGAEQIQGPK